MQNFMSDLLKYIRLIRVSDVVDILIVAVIIYYLIRLIRETRAMQVVKGIAIFFVVFVLSSWMKLNVLNYIMNAAVQVGVFALVVIFQPELRSVLERVGRFQVGSIIDLGTDTDEGQMRVINEVAEAMEHMSASKTGALIVMERQTRLGDFMSTGTVLNADVTSQLLENIFVPNTPLHDGAVIIRESKIMTAGCLLPLTSNNNLSTELGTRHRAALGLSEASDAIVLVVSEETGKISIAKGGALTRNLSKESLIKALTKLMPKNAETAETIGKIKFWKVSK